MDNEPSRGRMTFQQKKQKDLYFDAYDREFRRLFGRSPFDALIVGRLLTLYGFDLVAAAMVQTRARSFCTTTCRRSPVPSTRTCVMFTLYGELDGVVSVSKALSEAMPRNCRTVSESYREIRPYAPNVVIPDRIHTRAAEPVDSALVDWMSGPGKVFTISARLSPEKDHAKLLRAFKQIVDESPDTRLILIGDGVLAGELQRLTIELGLESSVFSTGMRTIHLRSCEEATVSSFRPTTRASRSFSSKPWSSACRWSRQILTAPGASCGPEREYGARTELGGRARRRHARLSGRRHTTSPV